MDSEELSELEDRTGDTSVLLVVGALLDDP